MCSSLPQNVCSVFGLGCRCLFGTSCLQSMWRHWAMQLSYAGERTITVSTVLLAHAGSTLDLMLGPVPFLFPNSSPLIDDVWHQRMHIVLGSAALLQHVDTCVQQMVLMQCAICAPQSGCGVLSCCRVKSQEDWMAKIGLRAPRQST